MNRGKWLLAFSCLLSAVFTYSCKEDTGSSGANILPKSDLISAFESDTTTLTTSMYLVDTVVTYPLSNNPLGSYCDPIFGQTKASIYTMVSPPVGATTTLPWSLDTGKVDSAVLILPISGYYANLDPQTFLVDTLESIITSGKVYSNTNIKYGSSPIGMAQVTPPNPTNSGDNTIRIKLNSSFKNYIVGKMNSHNAYYYPYFDSIVKGLYITVSNPLQLPGQGGILYVNLYNASTPAGIYLYFHDSINGGKEWPLPFPLGGTAAPYFSHFDHNYAISPFYNAHPPKPHDSIDANNLMYIQCLGGVLGRINFPYIHNWSKMNPVVINKAEVDITVNATDGQCPEYCPPPQLYLLGTNADGTIYAIPDYYQSYYDGTYNYSTNTYTFVITDYIQHVIDGKTIDRGLYLLPQNSATTADRVVLYGAQNPQSTATAQRMKLKMYYTPLKTAAKKR